MTPQRKALLKILNEGMAREDYDPNDYFDAVTIVAKEAGFIDDGQGGWKQKDEPRFLLALGMKATDVFKKFIKDYDNNYRIDLAVKEFYKLTDEEITDMMEELPFFNRSYIGHDQFKPTAANFLKGKIWKEEYPRKVNRDRSRKKTLHEMTTWDEYRATLPKENIDTISAYIDLGIRFEDFKLLIQSKDGIKEN